MQPFDQDYPYFDSMAQQMAPPRKLSPEEEVAMELEQRMGGGRSPAAAPQAMAQAKPQAPQFGNPIQTDSTGRPGVDLQELGHRLGDLGKRSAQFGTSSQDYGQTITPGLIPEDQRRELFDILNRRELDSMQAQKKSVDDTRAMLEAYNKVPVQTDLTPLMGLADSWTGSNLSKTYKPPQSFQERAGTLAKLQDDLSKQTKGLTEQDLDLAKQLMGAQSMIRNVAQTQTKVGADTFKPGGAGGGQKEREKLVKLFRSDPEVKPAFEQLYHAQNAVNTLASGSDIANEAFDTMMARAAGDRGALSERDVSKYASSPAIAEKLANAFDKFSTGRISDYTLEDKRILADAMVKRAQEQLALKSNHFITNIAPQVYGIEPGIAKQILIPDGGYGNSRINAQTMPFKTKDEARESFGNKPKLKVGDVVNGYKYMGGNSKDAKSWSKP